MSYKKNQDIYTKLYWIFTAFMLLTAIPLGVILIVVKLFEMRKRRRAAVFRPVPDAPLGTQTTIRPASRPAQEVLREGARKLQRRVVLGLLLGMASSACVAFFAMNDINVWTPACCVFASFFYLYRGVHTLLALGRCRGYYAAMNGQPVMAISELSTRATWPEKRVRADLELLEFMDLLPGAFFDRGRDLLFWFQTL